MGGGRSSAHEGERGKDGIRIRKVVHKRREPCPGFYVQFKRFALKFLCHGGYCTLFFIRTGVCPVGN